MNCCLRACRKQEEKIKEQEKQISALKNDLGHYKEQSKHFEEAYCSLFVDSGNSSMAKKKGLVSPPRIRDNKNFNSLEDKELAEVLSDFISS